NMSIYMVYGGDSLPTEIDSAYLNNQANAFKMDYTVPAGTNMAEFGIEMAAAGDVNGDGYDDLAIGLLGVDNDVLADSNGDTNVTNDNDGAVAVIYGHNTGIGSINDTAVYDGSMYMDVLSTASGESLVGTQDDDYLEQTSLAHDDLTFRGGAGNDIAAVLNGNFSDIDLGTGYDSIALLTDNDTLDFSSFSAESIKGVDDVSFFGNNQTLRLSLNNIFDFMKTSDLHSFTIDDLGTGNSLEIDNDLGSPTTADATAIEAMLGATATLNGGYYDFDVGGYTLSIEANLIDSDAVTII
ncbi:MAG: integrin alpha, partial [Alphaproteobacteria bacterium]|nr:integrin alpha [Alphaproteobacteria bacterium]